MSGKPDRVTFQARMDEMLAKLRTDIVSGIRPEGTYLPSEIVLGEQFHLSKKSVRKALDVLVREGWITKVPRVGNRVTLPASPSVTTVRLGLYASVEEQRFLNGLLERFYERYPHIRVETVTLPYSNYPHSIKSVLDNGFLDAFTLNNRNYRDMVDTGSLSMLEPQPSDPDHYPFLNRLFGEERTVHAVPFQFSPVVLCYNKDVFRSCGIAEPDSGWSWERLLENAREIRSRAGIHGFYAHIESLNRFPIFLLQAGYRFRQDDGGRYRFDDPALWDTLRACRDWFHGQGFLPAFLSERDAGAEMLFRQQKVAMIMTTYYGLGMLRDVPFRYDMTPLPFAGSPKTLLLATGIAINRFSGRKEAARRLVEFLTSETSQLFVQRTTLSIPAHRSAADRAEEEGLPGPSRYRLYREIVPAYADYAELGIRMKALDALGRELKLFWAGLEEPPSIIERLNGADV
ncbi:extracellular solute-binding protein [Paenibacillus flagellatus]|uniref:ABC transporter substrate-binding protein n=1 Tax=Paenibacillus flagellatus TaxID=2211139 RepID=A0A2V5KMH5_9BACL|nr:extracellular solute-binding protein [Paenibacillus flagellatus]PYI52147.1 ABC transporter substrate-binding protein [Paenibacillus flagellatus]